MYRGIISTIAQIISDYKVNVHAYTLKIPVSKTVFAFWEKKGSLATVQVFITKLLAHQWVYYYNFFCRTLNPDVNI